MRVQELNEIYSRKWWLSANTCPSKSQTYPYRKCFNNRLLRNAVKGVRGSKRKRELNISSVWYLATSKNNSKSMTKLRLCKNVMNFPWGHFVGRDELNEWFWRISLQIIDNSLIEPIVSWYRIFGTNFTQWSDFSVSYYVFCVSWKLAFLECIFIFYFLPTNEGNFQFIWHKDHSTKGSSFVFEFLQSWK